MLIFYYTKTTKEKKKAYPRLYLEGLKALLAGDDNLAFQKFKMVVEEDTNNIDAYLRLGDIFRRRKQIDKALQIHQELTMRPNLSPEEKADILKGIVEDFIEGKNFERATSVLRDIKKLVGEDLWTEKKLLSLYEKMGNWEMAFQTKQKILKQKKEEDKKVLALYKVFEGEQWLQKEEFHKARLAYKEALNLDELCVPAYFYLGEAYVADDRIEEAVESWKKLLENVPQSGYLVFDKLEKALFELGKYGEIVEIYEKALLSTPKATQVLFALANIFEKKGRNDQAEEKYRQILEMDSSFVPARLRLIRIYEQEKRGEKLRNSLNELLETFSPSQESFVCSQCECASSQPLWRCPNCQALDSFNI